MLTEIFMPSTPIVLLGVAVLAMLLALAWFVGGMAPNQRIAQRMEANPDKSGGEASPITQAGSTKDAA